MRELKIKCDFCGRDIKPGGSPYEGSLQLISENKYAGDAIKMGDVCGDCEADIRRFLKEMRAKKIVSDKGEK